MDIKETYDWYAKEGYLKALPRPWAAVPSDKKLTLYNYATKCVCMGNWNYHTRQARGLILNEEGNYVARPFSKFFALGERQETYLQNLPDDIPEIAIKYDGSLVIVFENPITNKWDAITRGCWDNDQTRFAKKWLYENEAGRAAGDSCNADKLESGYTYCFELVAPWNQVVIKYEEEKMILLGRINQWGMDTTYKEVAEYATKVGLASVEYFSGLVSEIDLEEIPDDIEGYVARFANGFRVKLKSPWYEELHKLMT